MSGRADSGGFPGVRRSPCVETLDPRQAEIFRSMTPAQRLATAFETTEFVRLVLRSGLRGLHPDWSDDRLDRAVAERFRGAPG